jgi:hypothetical protein
MADDAYLAGHEREHLYQISRRIQCIAEGLGAGRPVSSQLVRAIIRARRLRDEYLGPSLFADPAWDMLLELTAARLEGRRVSISSLCIASAAPATTALRWIRVMEDRVLIERHADPQDGRRIHVSLTDATAEKMVALLEAIQLDPGALM